MSITWQEPPTNVYRKWKPILETLKSKPGEWAMFEGIAKNTIYKYCNGPEWERRFITHSGRNEVYVRYLGDK